MSEASCSRYYGTDGCRKKLGITPEGTKCPALLVGQNICVGKFETGSTVIDFTVKLNNLAEKIAA